MLIIGFSSNMRSYRIKSSLSPCAWKSKMHNLLPAGVQKAVGLILMAAVMTAVSGKIWAGDLPFKPGERLTYVLKWGVVPAGEAVLAVLPLSAVDGVPAYHFHLTATSNAFVDLF